MVFKGVDVELGERYPGLDNVMGFVDSPFDAANSIGRTYEFYEKLGVGNTEEFLGRAH